MMKNKKKFTKEEKKLVVCLIIVGTLLTLSVLGEFFLTHNPYGVDMANTFRLPCKEFIFGTDNLGRCVFCRIVAGSKTSIFVALCVVGIVFVVGTFIGITAGFMGGIFDQVLMKITLIFQAFPSFILAVAVAGMLGTGIRNGMIALCAVYWTTYAKLARSLVLSIKGEDYIKAAKLNGAGNFTIIFRYILPNIINTMTVTASMDVGSVILSMAGLSFLGLGAARPTAEWGAVMSEAKTYLQTAPWIMVFNGVALFVVVIVFQLLGDRIRDILDSQTVKE